MDFCENSENGAQESKEIEKRNNALGATDMRVPASVASNGAINNNS
jgi:hypothetical protein